MAEDKEYTAEEAHLAIERAAATKPHMQRAREKLDKLVNSDDDRGMQMLANAIRRMLREG